MHMTLRSPNVPLALLALAALASAQNFTVSPLTFTNVEGPQANTWPWVALFRYQQVYTDLVGTPRLIQGLAWRRNQDQYSNTSATPRTLDMDVSMCASSHAAWSTTFANNYIGTPMQ